MPSIPSAPGARPVLLALQGGGSHGALAWGVLDRLLEEGDLTFPAISGTSAGAMNAAVLAAGLASGGPDGARTALAGFWRDVSRAGAHSPLQRTPSARLRGSWSLDDSPFYHWFDMLSRMVSPHQANPTGYHPLRSILARHTDLEALNSDAAPRIYITATNVRTGQPRVFSQPDLTVDKLLASAALPFMFAAIEIDGDAFWDGGYVGNPALFPLVLHANDCDLLLVQTNPFVRHELPTTARDITNRLNEITFNSSLLKELRLARMRQVVRPEAGEVRLHRVHADAELTQFSPSSKLNVEWAYLKHLFERGRAHADRFMTRHGSDIGKRTSFDLSSVLEQLMDGPIELMEVAP